MLTAASPPLASASAATVPPANRSPWAAHPALEQLSPGPMGLRVQQRCWPDLTALSGQADVALHWAQAPADGDWALGLLANPPAGARFDGQPVPADGLLVAPRALWRLVCPPGLAWQVVVVHQALLAPLWQQLYHKPLAAWLSEPMLLATTPARAQALRHLHQATLALPQPGLQQRDALLAEWIEAIPERVTPDASRARRSARELVQQARQQVLQHPAQPCTLPDLSRQLATSPKRLATSFQAHLGLPPAAYFRLARLQGVRRALQQADPGDTRGVHDIAAQWGFWHFGDLAALYRKWFGELPSATLAAARAGTPTTQGLGR